MKSQVLPRIVVIFIVMFLQFQAKAQMYVSSNSYVFAKNEVLFVKQQLELNASSSNLYLRENAQLLQGSENASANRGLGSLSVFQEGTTNNFQFNYWCSPVGGALASVGNSPFSITQLKDVAGLITSNDATILPMNNYNGQANPLAISPYWIYKLIGSATYTGWVTVGSAAALNAGEGFTMKGTAGTNSFTVNGVQNNSGSRQRYDFRGKPNDGTIQIPVGNAQFTLTGNPYPSALDLSAFLTEQTNCTGVAYFWEHDKTVSSHFIADYKGGYGVFSPAGGGGLGVYVPATFYSYDNSGNPGSIVSVGSSFARRFSPVGQGFMIKGTTNGNVQMKNTYRVFVKEGVLNNSEFERTASKDKKTINPVVEYLSKIQSVSGFDYKTVSAEVTPQIRFNTTLNNQGIRQVALAFVPQATDGIDRAMDAPSSNDRAAADMYFVLQDKEYLINVLNFDEEKKIAIGFKNEKPANYKITVKEILNFTAANEIYLHDKVTDMYYDIKNSFHNLDLPAGKNNTQFEITFKKNTTLGVGELANDDFTVYHKNSTKNIIIENPKGLDLSLCNVYDITGKLIFSKDKLGNSVSHQLPTNGLADGIYVLKLQTADNASIGKKIVVSN